MIGPQPGAELGTSRTEPPSNSVWFNIGLDRWDSHQPQAGARTTFSITSTVTLATFNINGLCVSLLVLRDVFRRGEHGVVFPDLLRDQRIELLVHG